MESKTPSIIDLSAELAKLTMLRRTPHSTMAERKGSVARLASYRDGLLLGIKSSGTDHWERHLTGDELIHILDGTATLEIVCDDGPQVLRDSRWNDRCHSAGRMAPLLLFGGHDGDDRDAFSRRARRARRRRPADGRAQAGTSNRGRHGRQVAQYHRPRRGTCDADHVPWTDPAVDDGGSKGERRSIGEHIPPTS